ncbi:DNA polymerase III subunit alpha [Geobacillus subterraneus]|uniref:DNA polymerase III subunit alpha n=2 Tax=Geobacillus TaxID=129337 RepID=A0ABM6A8R6_9BACL|nr:MULTISPECIES: DNA polymerase III subunit alpha [Geobacillus]AMX82632.1 DNA polymerase III subunit alpha [Geobacillus subterraneus]KZS26286.1 DNA polymerase III subunit alpha [Geobacillus subterraneus]OXB90723.1 DNA polymerase III subunit alpha [Geobacillus uzenensis]
MTFVHLHVLSGYSLLQSTATVEALAAKAKQLGYEALALTDRHVLYGAIPFYRECQRHGLRPIIGMTADVALDGDGVAFPLVLLAANEEGYRHLIEISTAVQMGEEKHIHEVALRRLSGGIIALTPGPDGRVESLLAAGEIARAKESLLRYRQLFAGRLHIAIRRGERTRAPYEGGLLRLAEETGVPIVATNDVRYVEREDALAWRCLQAIDRGVPLADMAEEAGRYLAAPDEMARRFADLPEALANSMKIANQCALHIEFGRRRLPKFPVPDGETADGYLRRLCEQGLARRVPSADARYRERLEHELRIIQTMRFSDYFLIVADVLAYARQRGILTGPGRGSAAGSLVAYVLSITDVDPIQYGLLFERFLNPERVSVPDIDLDFPDDRREDVIRYVVGKYGRDRVAQIITFGTFGAKAALRETAKALGVPRREAEQVMALLPNKQGVTISQWQRESAAFRRAFSALPNGERWLAIAQKLEGLPRHTSIHAAGVVISPEPLMRDVPLQPSHGEWPLTQYAMGALEALGLLKIDFLGLRTLSLLGEMVRLVERQTGKPFDVRALPLDDEKTYALLGAGDTSGVFQLESGGMKRVLAELRPSTLEEVVAVNALYRPGPMNMIPTYIRRKRGEEAISYLHPDLEPILAPTYGVLIYQEQIMQIAARLAGFSLGKADVLRRAVAKKEKALLAEYREEFVAGCAANGYPAPMAEELYRQIVRFADYGFNRSHAVSYTLLSYAMAYMKAHYPRCFYAVMLSNASGDREKMALYSREASRKGIPILPPSVNRSGYRFTVEGEAIRAGLAAVKHVGSAAKLIMDERREHGPFADFFDFAVRLLPKGLARPALEALISVGAFDELGGERGALLASMEIAIEHVQLMGPYLEAGGLSLKPKYADAPPLSPAERRQRENEWLGFAVTPHPAVVCRPLFQAARAVPIAEVHGSPAVVGGCIAELRKTRTKFGDEMAFITVSDESGEMEAVAFPSVYARAAGELAEGNFVLLAGTMEMRAGRRQLVLRRVERLSASALYIHARLADKPRLSALKPLLEQHRGSTPVYLYDEVKRTLLRLPEQYGVALTAPLIDALTALFGAGGLAVK